MNSTEQKEQDFAVENAELPTIEKRCSKCKVTKETREFHKNKNTKDGLNIQCKLCRSISRAKTSRPKLAKNVRDGFVYCQKCKKEKEATHENFHASKLTINSKVLTCIKCHRDINNARAQSPAKKAEQKIRSAAWARANRVHKNNKAREWKKNNKDKIKASNNSYMATEKAKILRSKSAAARYKLNPEKHKAKASAYCSRVRHSTPVWEDKKHILKYYQMATRLGLEVDHIVPINSKLVCGLHCLANFQFLNRKDNASKGNRFWPDMPKGE